MMGLKRLLGESVGFIQRKQYLRGIQRIRVSEGRDLGAGLRLDRNERVDAWPDDFLIDVMAAQPSYFLSVYPESGPLIEKIASFHGIRPTQVLLTAGIDGGIKTLFEVMTAPGDLVVTVDPTYAMYQVYARLFQVELGLVGYQSDFSLDIAGLNDLIAQHPTMIFLPNPNQPVESSLTLEDISDLAARCADANVLFVVDEAYHLFGADTAVSLIDGFPNVVVARTFSKGFGVPSIRLGYLLSSEENMEVLAKTRFAHESNALSNAVAEYLLDHFDIVEDYNGRVVESRDQIAKDLAARGIPTHGSNGNFLLLDLGSEERAIGFVRSLRDNAVYVKGPWREPWNRYVSITIGPLSTMQRFLAEVDAFLLAESGV